MSSGSSESGAGNGPPGRPDDEPSVGDRVGAYRLVRLLGGRANGLVYEVEHLERGGHAAMRVLPAGRAAAFGAVRRLFSETRAINELRNPHLVEVIDLIEAEQLGQTSAIVMELLQGRSLAYLIEKEKTFSTRRILSILGPVLDALGAIHQVRLVHGDIKPENVFLHTAAGRDELVKLLGFGLGRSVTIDRASSEDGWGPDEDTSINTPVYLSPEQAFGKELDHRTDIYSFGVILYRLLCGRLPYEGRNLSELYAELEMDPPRPTPRQILADPAGRRLDAIVRRCLEKEPAKRWSGVEELKEAFDGVLPGQPPGEKAASAGAASDKPAARRPWLVPAVVAAAALAAVAGVALSR